MSVKESVQTLAVERPNEIRATLEALRYTLARVEGADNKTEILEVIFGDVPDDGEEHLIFDLIHAIELFEKEREV